VITLGEVVLIHDLKRQGLSVSAIARKLGMDRKTVRKHLEVGIAAPAYSPRAVQPRLIAPYEDYLRARITAWPDLSGKRLLRELKERGYSGCYSVVTDFLRGARPPRTQVFERRFETAAGKQAQVDFAQFRVEFADEPGVVRILWLFTIILGHSRWLWGRFCATQDLQTVLRCRIDAFAAMDGAPSELLYDRMKTAVIGEDANGVVQYNTSLVALLNHYGAVPRACRPYRAKSEPLSAIGSRTMASGEDRAALPPYPAGLLAGAQLPQPRRPQRPVRRVAHAGRQSPGPRHHEQSC
jgi:transposase